MSATIERRAEQQPLSALKGVGPKMAQKYQRLGLHTVQDVLFHLPFRYQDRTRVVPIGEVRQGQSVVVEGKVELAEAVFRGRRNLLVRISDGTGFLTLRFFHFSSAQQANFKRGRGIRCFGEIRAGKSGPELIHPEYDYIDVDESDVEDYLTAVYPTTEGVHQLSIRKLVQQAVERFLPQVDELLPEDVLQSLRMNELRDALRTVHRPTPGDDIASLEAGVHPAQQRLAFEELLAHHLSLHVLRKSLQKESAPKLQVAEKLANQLLQLLPFSLTAAQQRVIEEINRDLEQPHPMQRLVQGDVGSGKTVVAAMAALNAVGNGYQVAIMAPTELLAEQHLNNFQAWLQPLDIEVIPLTGKLKTAARRQALELVADGTAQVVVGTHALFQEGVQFHRLGLIIVDEQHRFGVHQRLALREKGNHGGNYPHQLIMTATPIPRTMAQTIYADLDVSTIDELPPGRQAVESVVLPDSRRAEVVQRVAAACKEGRQAYWVCPLIEESEKLELQAATDTANELAAALPELNIELVHGRMTAREKEKIMQSFKSGKVDLLVATTVIEVGVDVPNASLMIIENSERLGLSQLHQLRGRVGRGAEKSSCVMLYQSPLGELARKRLAVMRETNDGFEISRQDMELRGPGELLGTRQTGMQQFRIADIMRDQKMLGPVREAAALIESRYPERIEPIINRWVNRAEDYAAV
ncbi:MAG: ATP-dependent DNA helicase RecG [Acidiferrobacterales bacterium]